MTDLDPNTLTPGIRKTVMWLRSLGFETTDSGDGVTNVAAGMEGAFDEPMVAIQCGSFQSLGFEFNRLHLVVAAKFLPAVDGWDRWDIQASYGMRDKVSMLLLTGVADKHLDWSRP